MVVCSERQRLRSLLTEAINTLCRTNVKYKFGFSVEGLLGITIDNGQVLLINIQEETKDRLWPDDNGPACPTGKAPPSPSNYSPIDLRMTASTHKQTSDEAAKSSTIQDPIQQTVSDSQPSRGNGLSPPSIGDAENSDIKPEVDLSLYDRSVDYNDRPSHDVGLGTVDGSRRKKRRRSILPHTGRVVKREPALSPHTVDKDICTKHTATVDTDADIIFIQDENDSDERCQQMADHSSLLSVPKTTPRYLSNQAGITATRSCSPSVQRASSPVTPLIVKIEDDSCSSGSIAEDTQTSMSLQDESPVQHKQDAPDNSICQPRTDSQGRSLKAGKAAKRSIQPLNPSHNIIAKTSHSRKNKRKGLLLNPRNTLDGRSVDASTVATSGERAEAASAATAAMALVHADQVDNTNLNQVNPQVEGDQTEWPTDLPRRPRASYSTAYKLMIVRKAIESGNMRATARRFGIHFKQVWQWTRNKEKLLVMSLSALRSPRLWAQSEEAERNNKDKAKPDNSSGSAPTPSTSNESTISVPTSSATSNNTET